ncbi:MAG: dihydrofolate reductase [Candidatus Kerfeldbacteria bacterium]|nr:dihydrofolate reductase [Candidatus Kerfeldbacteria bacterium]
MDAGVTLTVIAAVAENGVIGRGGDLPWKLSDDLKRFARLTKSHTVIVGRRTHEAIIGRLGGPLPDRKTIVVSSTTNPHAYAGMGLTIVPSLDHAVSAAGSDSSEVFVIGGAQLYREALPRAHRLLLTLVHASVDGDVTFPSFDWAEWGDDWFEFRDADERNEYPTTFVALKRRLKRVWPMGADVVEMQHARSDDQREVMQQIQDQGVCSFCPEHEHLNDFGQVRRAGHFWVLRDNRWPYKGTRAHLLAIPKEHAETLGDVRMSSLPELHLLCRWAEAEFGLTSGAIGLRFGDPARNGGTVRHLHAHLIAAVAADDPGFDNVRFRMGPKAQQDPFPA